MRLKDRLKIHTLSIFSYSGFISFFLLKNSINIYGTCISIYWSFVTYLLAPLLLSYLSIWIIKKLPQDDNEIVAENDIVPVEGNLIPTYIGMFVISLSLSAEAEVVSSIFVMSFLLIFWLNIGSVSYFNPFLTILGYRFYSVRTIKNKTITVIANVSDYKEIKELNNLSRINNYTFFWRANNE